MRTTADIVKGAGGVAALARALSVSSPHTVAAWVKRDSIPAPHWKRLAENNLATLDELAAIAAQRVS